MTGKTSTFVQKTFTPRVSKTYELVNHILTFGMDILWRKRAVRIAAAGGGTKWADMCSGTGETAALLTHLASDETRVYAVDFSENMLAVARQKPEAANITFMVSDVTSLDFPDNSLDLITISFATRNINLNKEVLLRTFSEFLRVLKPGGRFSNLETSQPRSPLFRKLFHFYIKMFVRPIGKFISGSEAGYTYLSRTIPAFYSADELDRILIQAGFIDVSHTLLFRGIGAIHTGIKA